MKLPGGAGRTGSGRALGLGCLDGAFRDGAFLDVAFLAVDFLALEALVARDFLMAAAFFAADDLLADMAFLFAADFFAAADRLAEVAFLVDFFAAATMASFLKGNVPLSLSVFADRAILKLLWLDRQMRDARGAGRCLRWVTRASPGRAWISHRSP